jgi:hypothetical protein
MRLGLYTFAALAFIGLVAGFVYTVAPGNYVLEIAGFNLNLPIALWIAAPLVVLLILTIFHMLYHGTRNYFVRRKWQRDADTLEDALYWSLIAEPKPHNYAVPHIGQSAALLGSASLHLNDLPEGVMPKLAKTAEWIKQIQTGEVVDLKAKKVDRFLSKTNPLRMRNDLNRLKDDPEFADEILRRRDEHAPEVVDAALQSALRTETLFKLKKYATLLNFDDFTVLLDRADAGEDIGLTQEMCEYFLEEMTLACSQYMRLVTTAIKAFGPDENLAMFKRYAAENTAAEAAYLYLLFRYEMIDQAKEFLEEHEEDEFIAFRAFYTLKKNKYNYKVRDFITADNACA